MKWPSSVATIILGMILLAASLIGRGSELSALGGIIVSLESWLGVLLVIVGLGRMLFLER